MMGEGSEVTLLLYSYGVKDMEPLASVTPTTAFKET